MNPDDMTKRALFRAPIKGRTPGGQRITGMEDRFTVWAKHAPLRGGEAVMQARMESRSPAAVTVECSSDTLTITSEWEVVIDGRTYQLKEDPRETRDRAFLDMLVEAR